VSPDVLARSLHALHAGFVPAPAQPLGVRRQVEIPKPRPGQLAQRVATATFSPRDLVVDVLGDAHPRMPISISTPQGCGGLISSRLQPQEGQGQRPGQSRLTDSP
jgi:hypothetical protein